MLVAIGTATLQLRRGTNPGGQPTPTLEGKPLAGYVEMRQVQAAYIGSGSAGDGTLRYRGSTWRQDPVGILRAMMIDD